MLQVVVYWKFKDDMRLNKDKAKNDSTVFSRKFPQLPFLNNARYSRQQQSLAIKTRQWQRQTSKTRGRLAGLATYQNVFKL